MGRAWGRPGFAGARPILRPIIAPLIKSQRLFAFDPGREGTGGDMAGWDKVDIVHFLSDRRGYRRYLEICTPSTGHQFAKIVRAKFEVCHRLMYRCPETFHDGLNVDFRTPALDATELFDGLHGQGLRYDVILVDSF